MPDAQSNRFVHMECIDPLRRLLERSAAAKWARTGTSDDISLESVLSLNKNPADAGLLC